MTDETLLQRMGRAARVLTGADDGGAVQAAMLRGLSASAGGIGAPPSRTARQRLAAYSQQPHLHIATSKIADEVATVTWEVFAPRSAQRRDVAAIQRGGDVWTRRKAIERGIGDGTLERLDDHPLINALTRGNETHTGQQLFRLSTLHLLLVGESHWGLERNALGTPVGFLPLPSHWIAATPTPSEPTYRISHQNWQAVVPASEILSMIDPDPIDPFGRGGGATQAIADELDTDEATAQYIRYFFRNRARPDIIVSPKGGPRDTSLKMSELSRFEESWVSQHQGFARSWRPYFSPRELNVTEIKQDTSGIQLTGLRAWARDTILQLFSIPPELVGLVENSNRATISAADHLFKRNTILPKLELIRSCLQTRLVPEYDPALVLDFKSPVEKDREHALAVAKAAPFAVSIDEWRAMADLPPLPDNEGKEFVYGRDQTPVRRARDRRHRFDDM